MYACESGTVNAPRSSGPGRPGLETGLSGATVRSGRPGRADARLRRASFQCPQASCSIRTLEPAQDQESGIVKAMMSASEPESQVMAARPQRNQPCPCGSGRKYKHCCGKAAASASPLPAALAPSPSAGLSGLPLPRSPRPFTGRAGPGRRGARPGGSRSAFHIAAAVRLRTAGQLEESLPHLERAAALDARNPHIPLDLGTTLYACRRYAEAIPHFRRAIALDPTLARAYLHLGMALHELGREAEAFGPFERAAALEPTLAEAHRWCGVLLHTWGMNPRAAQAYRAAAAAAAAETQQLMDMAKALRMEGNIPQAQAALERARALEPGNAEISELLSRLECEQGRFAEAETRLRALLASDPTRAVAAQQLLSFVKLGESDRPLLARLAAEASRPQLTRHARMLFGFALGRAYEHLGDYAQAMLHYDRANALRAAVAPLDREGLERQTEALIAAFPPGSLDEACGAPGDERAVFILGLPRSGTTLVEQIVSSHPAVTAGGEIGFWSAHAPDALAAGAGAGTLAPLAERYGALLADLGPASARVTDKNPFNFHWVGLLRRALPRARIIHVRRSPIDTALSIYTTYLSSRRTFFVGNREDLLFWYDRYVRLMAHWRAVMPGERFLEIDYETLVTDRERQTRRLIEFCGLPWDEACLHPEDNRRTITTASLWQARQSVHSGSIGRWRRYAPWLGPLQRLAPPQERPEGGWAFRPGASPGPQ